MNAASSVTSKDTRKIFPVVWNVDSTFGISLISSVLKSYPKVAVQHILEIFFFSFSSITFKARLEKGTIMSKKNCVVNIFIRNHLQDAKPVEWLPWYRQYLQTALLCTYKFCIISYKKHTKTSFNF